MKIKNINTDDYDYDLPKDRIAQYPVKERDTSKLLILKDSVISHDIFKRIDDYLPQGSLLVFNNSRVIRARLLFGKETGARIEILCLEPLLPEEYESSFHSKEPVEWKCIIGNLKKWKKGPVRTRFLHNGKTFTLEATRLEQDGEAWRIRFKWDAPHLGFGEVTDLAGHVPLPPYISRTDEESDAETYQTVYSSRKGSVAAPTAGLHFTSHVLGKLREKGIKSNEITLHVGAGTFQPMKTSNAFDHEMHCEHFFVTADSIKEIIENQGKIIAVGTTSVRTIESLYWLGIKVLRNMPLMNKSFTLGQWEAYDHESEIPVKEALNALLKYIESNNLLILHATTSIMIIPGYRFRIINGIVTNFHQPRSTLLLLISAFTGDKWKEVYRYALDNGFRFLSYGDSSLLLS
jgi:S-adenosylmethionine:tRNA ribosyltransferase-isomerase